MFSSWMEKMKVLLKLKQQQSSKNREILEALLVDNATLFYLGGWSHYYLI